MDPKETYGSRVKTLAWSTSLLEACGPLAKVVSKLLYLGRHMLLPFGMLLMERITGHVSCS